MMFKRECRRAERALWRLAAGREGEAQAARVHAHLRQCSACRVQWQAVQQTQAGLADLRARPVPSSRTDWRQVQALIAQTRDRLPAAPQTTHPASVVRRRAAGKRPAWSGATAVLALCCLIVGTAHLPHEAYTSMRGKKEAPADDAYKSHPLTLTASLPNPVTFFGAMPSAWNAAPFIRAASAQTQEQRNIVRHAAANIRSHHSYIYGARIAGQNARRRRRLALAALHRKLQTELLAALISEQYQGTNPMLLTASAAGAGRVEPEYVMTTAEVTAPTPRRYIMDSINVDAQSAGQANVDGLAVPRAADSQNILDNVQGRSPHNFGAPGNSNNNSDSPTNKEIRAW